MSCYVVIAQGEHDFSEGACPCGTEPPELGGKMAAERHVGTPDCLNGTCACGSAPKPEEEFDGTAWLRKHGSHTDPPCHECERIEQGRVKERREGIATEVLAAFVTHNSVSPQINWQLTAQCALKAADALIVELDK